MAQLQRLFRDLQGLCRVCGALGTQLHAGRTSLILRSDCFFPPGKSILKPGALRAIKPLAQALRAIKGRRYLIAAHLRIGDSERPAYRSPWSLSAAQAATLVKALQDQGIAPGRLGAVGFGDTDEPMDYDGPAALAPGDNDLIEIVLSPSWDECPSPTPAAGNEGS